MKNAKTYLLLSLLNLCMIVYPNEAKADGYLDWRIEGDTKGEFNSNIRQLTDEDSGDFVNSYSLNGILRYRAPTQTQIMARVQAQYNKYLKLNDYDVVVFAGSLTASQWLFKSFNVYAGIQPIQLVSTVNENRPFDFDILGGLTYYLPFNNDIAFAGYQIDRLFASDEDYSALNHTFLVGLKHPFTSNFIGNINAKVRFRNLDINENDKRFSSTISAQYYFTKWLTLQAAGEYMLINYSDPDEPSAGVFNFGLNLIAGFNGTIKL